ncbi:MAG: 3-oxoacyl-ACP reductase FabG [Candidatus Brocadiae bacterium]|nr:3-oxoacyl-ACP reductase FabG [Candidatus Brocadiia bacterium]
MSENAKRPFTASSYYQYLAEKKIMGSRSQKTGTIYLPPKAICPETHSSDFEWVELSAKGKLISFTVVHIGPSFMNAAGFSKDNPYVTGIVELEQGPRVSARIMGVDPKNPGSIAIGSPLKAEFVSQFDGKVSRTILAFSPIKDEKEQDKNMEEKKTTTTNQRLAGKVALVTGGAAGIGKATAERFAQEGAKVIICDLNETLGQALVAKLGPDASFNKVNVANRQEVQTWIDGVYAKYNRIDILVNNAGIVRDSQLVRVKDGALVKQMSEADFDLVISVNLKGTFNCTQAVAPYMIKQGSGVILNASSVVGVDGNFGQTNYVATKSGVIGMTKVWSRELGKFNIRVNAVAPGFTATEILTSMPEKVLQDMKSHTPLGRLGDPNDIANAYLFLASDEAAFITGTVLKVDGGLVVGT